MVSQRLPNMIATSAEVGGMVDSQSRPMIAPKISVMAGLGGVLFERTGSYDVVWWGTIFFGIASAIINLPIVEKPVPRRTAMAV